MKENKKMYPVYGVIGMVILFLMGAIFGYIINGSDRINRSTMSLQDCNNIASRIMNAARDNQPDLIEQLNKVYSMNCLNREFEQPKPQPKAEEQKLPESNCEAIEELLRHDLIPEYTNDYYAHEHNAQIYQNLSVKGCPENKSKYMNMWERESTIANALRDDAKAQIDESAPTCIQIESLLLRRLNDFGVDYSNGRIDRAKIYANLSERGCAEHSAKYKELAKQELEIARALNDDNLEDRHESVEIVETYKRLQMQAEAERMIEKAKKLTNPAIDFIIQLEKIIEE